MFARWFVVSHREITTEKTGITGAYCGHILLGPYSNPRSRDSSNHHEGSWGYKESYIGVQWVLLRTDEIWNNWLASGWWIGVKWKTSAVCQNLKTDGSHFVFKLSACYKYLMMWYPGFDMLCYNQSSSRLYTYKQDCSPMCIGSLPRKDVGVTCCSSGFRNP